jgi:hypothetical protein
MAEIASAINAHRPEPLYDIFTSGTHVHIQAMRADGHPMSDEWNMEVRNGDMFLSIAVDGNLYQEVLPKGTPWRFTSAMNGLRDWGKAVNALELKELLRAHPNLRHLEAGHVMDPNEYSPFGGGRRW